MDETEVPDTPEAAQALVDQIESDSGSKIDAASTETPKTPEEFAFTHGGKEIKATRENILKWASMGYDAPNRIGELNKQLESWKSRDKAFKDIETKYGEVDKYVRTNPQFWQHVLEQYQKRDQMTQDPANPMAPVLQSLQQRLEKQEAWISERTAKEEAEQVKQQDEQYKGELEGLKKTYPKIDFQTPDDQGKSLEFKVLEYARDNGIGKLTTAFRDFYFDELQKIHMEEAKEKLVKGKIQNTKSGLLGVTSTPSKKISEDVKGKSWNQVTQDIIEEMGLH